MKKAGATTGNHPRTTTYPTRTPSQIQKNAPAYSRLTKKHTQNLETWVNTTQQTVHYLLNADDNPNNNTQLDAID
jgi:hypothetical protein